MGEGPVLHVSGFHPPALSENANQHKTTQSQLFSIENYSTNSGRMQAFFGFLKETSGRPMVAAQQDY